MKKTLGTVALSLLISSAANAWPVVGTAVNKNQMDHISIFSKKLVGCNAMINGFQEDGNTKSFIREIPAIQSVELSVQLTPAELKVRSYVSYIVCCDNRDVDIESYASMKDGTIITGRSGAAEGCTTLPIFTLQ